MVRDGVPFHMSDENVWIWHFHVWFQRVRISVDWTMRLTSPTLLRVKKFTIHGLDELAICHVDIAPSIPSECAISKIVAHTCPHFNQYNETTTLPSLCGSLTMLRTDAHGRLRTDALKSSCTTGSVLKNCDWDGLPPSPLLVLLPLVELEIQQFLVFRLKPGR